MNDTYWEGRSVLVTGAEGFIGSTLVDALVERGARVRALCHTSRTDLLGGSPGTPRTTASR